MTRYPARRPDDERLQRDRRRQRDETHQRDAERQRDEELRDLLAVRQSSMRSMPPHMQQLHVKFLLEALNCTADPDLEHRAQIWLKEFLQPLRASIVDVEVILDVDGYRPTTEDARP